MYLIQDGLYRGPRRSPEDLVDAGVTKVINFQYGFFEFFHDDEYESFEWEFFNIKHVAIPMSDFWVPTLEQILEAHKEIKAELARGGKVYIHCAKGVDRTGMVAALWRIREQRWGVQKAIDEMIAHGMHWWYRWWTNYLWDYSS